MEEIMQSIARPEPIEKTVVLWGEDDVLVTAVAHVLSTRRDWKMLRISNVQDETVLLSQFEHIKPEVLIVHKHVLATNSLPLIKFIQMYPELIIITVNPENNRMEIYDKQTIQIKESTDLLRVIEKSINPVKQGCEEKPLPALHEQISSTT